jgi:DNA-binding MarR family transcriptional regulator
MYSDAMAAIRGGPVPSTGYLVWRLAVKWRAGLDRALQPLGLTSAQYGLLASLHGLSRAGQAPSQRELADFSGLEPMFVSKLARALERAGLLERGVNPADPRARGLTLTPRGIELVAAGRAIVSDLEERHLAVLGGPGSARTRQLQEAVRTLLEHADAADATQAAARRRRSASQGRTQQGRQEGPQQR